MKRNVLVVSIMCMLALVGWAAYQAVSSPTERPLSRLMPQGAQVYLEAKDLAGLLQEWNASPEKQAWLKSDNHDVFSRSRLFGRLEQAQAQFAAAAGVPPDYAFLQQVAGQQSALAIYDIGKLELLFVSRVPSAKSLENALWQNRAKFDPRESDGKKFFVRTDAESGRVVAFAVEGDYLVLGTREDLVAGALSLMAGKKVATLGDESWFAQAWKAGKEPGDIRLLVHLADVTRTPQFRTYWIQQNITDLRQYDSSIADLYRTPTEYREERTLLLKSAPDQNAVALTEDSSRQVADVLRFAPAESGFYEAHAAPSADTAVALLETKVLTPHTGPVPLGTAAPNAVLTEGTVGSASDLETRIDIAPSAPKELSHGDEALKALIAKADVRAALELHASETAPDGVFVRPNATIILAARNDWDEPAVQSALQSLLAPGLTAGQLGVAWTKVGSGSESYSSLSGLHPVSLAVRRKYLVVSNAPNTVSAVLARFVQKPNADPALYYAAFSHQGERQRFYRLTSLIDQPSRLGTNGAGAEPQSFSQNIASLSNTLNGLQKESIVVRRHGSVETQTVRYEWSH